MKNARLSPNHPSFLPCHLHQRLAVVHGAAHNRRHHVGDRGPDVVQRGGRPGGRRGGERRRGGSTHRGGERGGSTHRGGERRRGGGTHRRLHLLLHRTPAKRGLRRAHARHQLAPVKHADRDHGVKQHSVGHHHALHHAHAVRHPHGGQPAARQTGGHGGARHAVARPRAPLDGGGGRAAGGEGGRGTVERAVGGAVGGLAGRAE